MAQHGRNASARPSLACRRRQLFLGSEKGGTGEEREETRGGEVEWKLSLQLAVS